MSAATSDPADDDYGVEWVDRASKAWWWISRDGHYDYDGEWQASRVPALSGPLTGTGLRVSMVATKPPRGRYRYTHWSATYLGGSTRGRCRSRADALRRAEAWWKAERAALFAAESPRTRWHRLFRWDGAQWEPVVIVPDAWSTLTEFLHGCVVSGVYAAVAPDGSERYYELTYDSLCGCGRITPTGGPVRKVYGWRTGSHRVLIPPVRAFPGLAQ